uniref:Uncharacterized protein n=1 Tax=Melanopsichium pennsylvanicum 4 TaxID=1398559 RepID=A0A077R6W5_9BASI|nr:uncharacterized protein BN887_06082 [Melanopsichium pennsylvanicum 4]
MVNIGDKMLMDGVILQGVSYIYFKLLLTYATILVIRERSRDGSNQIQANTIMGLEKPVFALVAGLGTAAT